jgi:hypothetical protein
MDNGFTNARAIIPSDAINLPGAISAFTVGVGGTVTLTTVNGQIVQIVAVAGFVYPIQVTKVAATGTAATGIVGYW